ncbi:MULTISPECIES: Na(+)/H(+) antiporter subunit B [Cyanophyceae]|uniref:Na(+)/H(+) antiporter subunit B n=3 Tax=Cyanobacteriota TaxID=1117 RepID=UPI0000DA5BB4|nr:MULTISPECIES: Na(+)/H(+) antiporter subunit B [Cyanophyceae]MEB3225053.1 Na(+)/H(+) antiporter subunit B [Synechococcus sp.]ABG46430.1 MnhB [Picosynechococcus sp. PCC 7002]ACB00358.1 Multisubunit Na+/H+ antiporter, B subunit [Picosynechococcus sp. PCC 7002]AMA09953.1 cation:proton antiporter [Picosynechococcus sp. PCC 73109]ANV88115.1 cation:proton antiporter [Picosynechococcus sp. PCC 7117]
MKWVYLAFGISLFVKMLVFPNFAMEGEIGAIAEVVAAEAGVPNAVSGIILRNRLYDTGFEVMVFTLAIMGVRFLLADEHPSKEVKQFTDSPSIVLARLGATIAALIGIELAIRGHLSPGGGFAAGVAGGTAIGLVAIVSSPQWMDAIYKKWNAAILEKISVLVFFLLAALSLMGFQLPHGEFGTLFSGGWITILNIIVAVKVALGSWAAILMFIRYRGLL